MDTYPRRIEPTVLGSEEADQLFMLSHRIEQKNRRSVCNTADAADTVSGPDNRGLQYRGTVRKADGVPVMFFSH